MRDTIKLACAEQFADFIHSKIVENAEENKKQSFTEMVEEYFENNCFEYEDEHETYDTMRDKTDEVRYYLGNLLKMEV